VFRRALGALVASSAILLSWGAAAQPMAPLFRPGITPAPAGSAGRYELRHPRSHAVFTPRGVELRLPSRTQASRALGWSVVGGRPVAPRAEKPREAKLHRLLGPTKSWEREVPTYEGLRYPGVLPGVDLWFEERAEGVEYGFRAERGADLRRVRLEYAGAREVRVVEQGRALEVELGEGVLREQGLHCTQEQADGGAKGVGCRFTDARRMGPERWSYAIEVDVEDPERPVVVDPLVLWNTYLGGPPGTDALVSIQQNATGELFIAGTVGFLPEYLPAVRNSRIGTLGGSTDVFVAKFQAEGALEWWTVFGDTGDDFASALVVGESGELYVAGSSSSRRFQWKLPNGEAGESVANPDEPRDGFVARLDPTGAQLDWFHRIGWNGVETVHALIQGGQGRLFVAGKTTATLIPDTLPTDGGIMSEEGFIIRLDPSQRKADWTLLVQTIGSGAPDDAVLGLAYKSPGILYATGYYTDVGSDTAPKNTFAALISDVDGPAPRVRSKVGLGRTRDEVGIAVTPVTVGTGDKLLMWGTTTSTDFPGAGQVQGGSDIFVTVLADDGGTLNLESSKLLGGTGVDALRTVTSGPSQRFYLGGVTLSQNLSVEGGFDTTLQDTTYGDGFVARVRVEPEPVIEWASYVGGSGRDEVLAVRVDNQSQDRLFIGGFTSSVDLRYADAGVDTNLEGAFTNDMFLLAVDLNRSPGDGTTTPDGGGGNGEELEGGVSPLGWSCGASGSNGGVGALALGSFVGLGLLAFRRKRTLH
jgi:hypothetical protein